MVLVKDTVTDIHTSTGVMRTYVYEPNLAPSVHNPKKYGGVVLYSAIFQNAPTIQRMAKKIAGEGYVVVVPEIFHESLPAGTVLSADVPGTEKGTELKKATKLSSYQEGLDMLVYYLKKHMQCNGCIGAIGFCVGGHIALRAAFHPEILSSACLFATDIITGTLGSFDGSIKSLSELHKVQGEVMMVWGRQDPHIPDNQRKEIYETFQNSKINFTWHEFNANHSFMMDEDPKGRYDPAVACLTYTLVFDLFHRTL